MTNNINFATATSAQLAEAGFTVTTLRSAATRKHKSQLGCKATHSKKGCKKAKAAQANEASTGTIR